MNPEPTTHAKKAAEPMTPQQKADLRDYWRNIGGSFHGPATIPEERLLPLLDELHQARKVLSSDAAELARLRGEVAEARKRDGNLIDKSGRCVVCGNLDRPHAATCHAGHLENWLDALKSELADAKRERDEARAQLQSAIINTDYRSQVETELSTLRTALATAQADSARLDWLEQSVQGTGASRFLKSVFISYALGSETDLLLDVKGEDVIRATSLRAAIDSAMKPTP